MKTDTSCRPAVYNIIVNFPAPSKRPWFFTVCDNGRSQMGKKVDNDSSAKESLLGEEKLKQPADK